MVTLSSGTIDGSNINIIGDAGGLALQVYTGGTITASGLSANLDSGDSTTVDNTGLSFGGFSSLVNTVNLKDSTFNITGNNALGVRVRSGDNRLNLVNSSINAENGTAIYAMVDTDLTVNADNSTLAGKTLLQSGDLTDPTSMVKSTYDYNLTRGEGVNDKKWFLLSESTPDGKELIERPEAGSYVANLAAANTLFNTSLDDRLGETSYVDALTGETKVTSLWMRNEGGHNSSKDSSGQLKTTGNRYVMQLGGDVAQWTSNGDDRFHLGVMGGYANAQNNTRSNVTGYSSKAQINGYSAGVYGSWMQDNAAKTGAYLDSWALYNWFNNSVKGDAIGEESYKSKGITASLEGGYTFKVGELNSRQSYYVQPKAQVTWMGVEANNHTESNGTQVADEGNNNVQTRLGVRAFIKGHSKVDDGKQTTFEPFVEANWLHNTEAFGTNMNGVSIRQAGASNIGEVKVGVDAKLTNKVNLWGNIGQQIGDKGYSDSSATIGLKVNF